MRFAFDADRPLADNFGQLARAELRAAREIAGDETKAPRERVHEVRTLCKKLRGLLRLVEPGFAAFKQENAAISKAARELSSARDITVMAKTFSELLEDPSLQLSEAARQAIFAAIEHDELGETAQAEVLAHFALAIAPVEQRAARWRLEGRAWTLAAKGAAKTYGRARTAMETARRTALPTDFHEWRKHAKYHWHHLSLLREFDGAGLKARRQRTSTLTGLLGRIHDQQALRDGPIANAPTPESHAELARAIDASQKALERFSLELGGELFEARPAKWRDEIEALLRKRA